MVEDYTQQVNRDVTARYVLAAADWQAMSPPTSLLVFSTLLYNHNPVI